MRKSGLGARFSHDEEWMMKRLCALILAVTALFGCAVGSKAPEKDFAPATTVQP